MEYEKIIIAIIVAIVLPLVIYLITNGVKYLKQLAGQIENETIREIVLNAVSSVEQAVIYVMQTYVDSLKISGKFDKEAQQLAYIKAKEKATELINAEAQAIIADTYGDFEVWLQTKIEQTVRSTKLEALAESGTTTSTAAATAASVATTIAQTAVAQLGAEAQEKTE